MEKITDYKICIGDKLDYVEDDCEVRMPVVVRNIIFDGFVFLIEFRHQGETTYGSTQYPERLKQRL